VSPERRRRAVRVLQQRFGVSERRACRVVGQHRSTQRKPAVEPSSVEQAVRERLRQIAAAKPRWGWRKAYWVLRAEGRVVNHKRVRAYWLDEGLKRPAKARKRRRVGPRAGDRLIASRPDHVWAIDY
jgi:putative transposase